MIKLTILIPTKGRSKPLDNTIKRIVNSVDFANISKDLFELVVVDNFSTDETYKTVLKWSSKFSYIKYFKHTTFCNSAEQSLFNAVRYCSGEYIWCFGDDDYINKISIQYLINFLFNSSCDFILLNCDILTEKRKLVQYMRSNMDILEYDSGLDMFKDFGLISATTTISCLVFKKDKIDINLFLEFSKISSIYSHSFFLLATFYNSKVCFISKVLLVYKSNSINQESKNILNLSKKLNQLEFYSFNIGLVKLIQKLSENTNISEKEILKFKEVEISKDSWCVKHSILIYFILQFFCYQVIIFLKYNIFQRLLRKKVISNFFDELLYVIVFIDDEHNRIAFINLVKNIKKIFHKLYFKKRNIKKIKNLTSELKQLILNSENKELKLEFTENKDLDISNSEPFLLTKSNFPIKSLLSKAIGKIENIKPSNHKVLTILIPTYQRPNEILELVQFFINNKLSQIIDIEILFAVNHKVGIDFSSKIISLSIYDSSNIKIKKFDDFVYSAEENINRSIEFCSGEYIFILGDDDIINLKSFKFILDIIRKKEFDVYILNSTNESNDICPDFDGLMVNSNNFTNIIRNYGLTYSMSYISRYIIKKNIFRDMKEYIKISRIYSHIFSFIDFFYQKNIITISLSMAIRRESVVAERFKELLEIDNKNKFYYWTTGLLLQFVNLINKGLVSDKLFFLIKEKVSNDRTYFLWKDVLNNFYLQQKLFLENSDNSQRLREYDLFALKKMNISVLCNKDRKYFIEFIKIIEENINLENTKVKESDFEQKISQIIENILS